MPTGQQLYSPTGFLPVPMSSPSGYAAGDGLLNSVSVLWESAWPKLNYSIGVLEMCVGVGMAKFSFLLRLVTNYPGNLNG